MTKKEAIHFLYQIADEIRSFLDKTSSPKGQWTSHKRLEALSMAISALYDLFQAEEDGRLIIPPCKVGDILASSSKTATAILSLLIVSTELLTVFVPPTSKMKRCWPIKRGEILY
jgi:predicted lipoprotein